MDSPERSETGVAATVRRGIRWPLRALLRFVYPEYEAQQEQLRVITRAVAEQTAEREKQLTTLSTVLADHPTRADFRKLSGELNEFRGALDRHHRFTRRALRRGDLRHEQTVEERRFWKRIEWLAASRRPILIGPWSGEVGFELLYWIPFVHWVREHAGLDPDRLVVISRGGASPWYRHITPHYLDALSYVSTDEFRAATVAGEKKQRMLLQFDRVLLRRIARARSLGRIHLLHPGLMYRLFWPYWKQQEPMRRIESYTTHVPLRVVDSADLPPGLPSDYVAVRFYFSQCFPDTPRNRAFVAEVIRTLTSRTDVVLLNTPFAIDDHVDYGLGAHDRVRTVEQYMAPERNLAVQTAIISRARAFVGTYGGYSYLAPLYGVSSLAFYSERTFFAHHLDFAQRVFSRLNTASLVPLDVASADLVRAALDRSDVTPARAVRGLATGAGA